jgi:hypothetical protein
MSAALVAGLAVAGSSGATSDTVTVSSESISETVAETRVPTTSEDAVSDTSRAATPDTVAETSVATTPETAAVEIMPPDERWGGASRGEWDARSYQWAVSMPEAVNPLFDATGERCGYGQSGPVFFLPGNFAEGSAEGVHRTCVVAEGTAIYLGVVGANCSTLEPSPFFGRTEDELRACASAWLDNEIVDFEARIDGHAVADLNAYRFSSPLFTLTYPANNIFGAEPGVAQAVSEGYGFIIAPPPPGEYEIAWSVLSVGASERFAITVNLVVEAPQVIEPPSPTTT